MRQETATALTTIAGQIETILQTEEDSASASRWKRGKLYREARKLLASDQEFGKWCEEIQSCDVARLDDAATINRLMRCVQYLDEDQFYNLKYSRAVEVVPRWLWEKTETLNLNDHLTDDEIKERNTAIIEKIHSEKWSVKTCRQYVKELKQGLEKLAIERANKKTEEVKPTPPNEIDLLSEWQENNKVLAAENEELKQQLKESYDLINAKDKQIAVLKNTLDQLRKAADKKKRKQPSLIERQIEPTQQAPY